MSNLTTFVADAFEDHLTFLSVDVVIDGTLYKGVPAEAEISPQLDIGGVSDESDGGVILKVETLHKLPKVGSRIQVAESNVRVRSIKKSEGDPLLLIEYSGFSER